MNVYAWDYKTYSIGEVDILLQLPDDFVVFTQEMDEDDLDYLRFKDSYPDVATAAQGYLGEHKNVLMDAIRINDAGVFDTEFVVFSEDLAIDNAEWMQADISELAKEMVKEFELFGMTHVSSDVYKHDSIKYAVIKGEVAEGSITKISYGSVFNGRFITFTFSVPSEKWVGSEIDMMENVINSIVSTKQMSNGSDSTKVDTPKPSTSGDTSFKNEFQLSTEQYYLNQEELKENVDKALQERIEMNKALQEQQRQEDKAIASYAATKGIAVAIVSAVVYSIIAAFIKKKKD